MLVLTLNCGSSSVKYQVYDWDNHAVLGVGLVERVTQEGSVIKHNTIGKDDVKIKHDCPTHKEAIELIINTLLDKENGCVDDKEKIKAVGHRVVHGGEKFNKSVIVTPEVIDTFKEVQDLSPLHNPANIMGIEAAQKIFPNATHAAIMDTAWHQTMPQKSFLYALPYEWYEKHGVRRYGFHGTSFLYTAKRAAVLLGRDPFDTNVIIAHIGNGASINAVKNGCSYDTSMGLTPLEGLVMGTRSGDHDPAIAHYMMRKAGMTSDEVESALNKESGVLGITGQYIDRLDIEIASDKGDERSQLALEIESYRLRKYVGAYAAALGRVDAIVITAGAGEMGAITREIALSGLENLGIKLDTEKNDLAMSRRAETCISTDDSPVKIFVIPTDEELVMTEDTVALMEGRYDVHTNFTYSFQKSSYVNKQRQDELEAKEFKKKPRIKEIVAKPPVSCVTWDRPEN